MTEALLDIENPEEHVSTVLDEEIIRETYAVMFTIGIIELALKLVFF